jgi:hypothetical protein
MTLYSSFPAKKAPRAGVNDWQVKKSDLDVFGIAAHRFSPFVEIRMVVRVDDVVGHEALAARARSHATRSPMRQYLRLLMTTGRGKFSVLLSNHRSRVLSAMS